MRLNAHHQWSVAFILSLILSHAEGATLFVSPGGDGTDGLSWQTAHQRIKDAVVASATGDEIWIRFATYEENVIVTQPLTLLGGFSGTESLTQRDLRNPAKYQSIVDGNQNNSPVFKIDSTQVRLEGLTIQNGLAFSGSGVRISDSTAFLHLVAVSRNGQIPRCDVGGGIYISESNVEITASSICNNLSESGGGVFIDDSVVSIMDTFLDGNSANKGGALTIGMTALVEVDSCSISNNSAMLEIDPHTMFGFGGEGSGIYLNAAGGETTLQVKNSLFDSNVGINGGGFGSVFHGTFPFVAKFSHCTCIVGCETAGFDRTRFGSFPSITNCIVVSKQPGCSIPINAGESVVTYSLVEGGYPGEGNIDADPKFVDPANGNYHLQRSSPCIDSGTDTGLDHDFDGNFRPIGNFDMGAFEFPFLRSDIDGSGKVDSTDLLILQEDWKKVSGS